MSHLNDNERLHLDKMLKEFDAEDNTNKIRELRHSYKIRDNIANKRKPGRPKGIGPALSKE